MTTTSIPVEIPTSDPLEDALPEPRERVHHDPVPASRVLARLYG